MIKVNNFNLSLDRKEKNTDLDFISHAHSDHISASKSSKSVISSDETADLIKAAYDIEVKRAFNYNTKIIKLIDSGHMLGAKQISIEDYNLGKKIIYSGDYLMSESLAAPKIKIEACDVLIIDSTYPSPNFRFNPRKEVEYQIEEWVEKKINEGIILFSAYSMGKAQELIKIMNNIGITPVVNEKINSISKVYNKYNSNLNYVSVYNEADKDRVSDLLNDNFVGIINGNSIKNTKHMLSFLHKKPVFTAVATGFSNIYKSSTDASFQLSDHSDFYQALDYIEATGAKEVYTYGGNSELFAENLRKLKVNAQPFKNFKQTENLIKININNIKLIKFK